MKKIIIPLIIVICISIVVFLIACRNKESTETVMEKVHKEEYRSISIVNETNEQFIKEAILYTAEGNRIASIQQIENENIVFDNFDKDRSFVAINDFEIVLIDRFDFKYQKSFSTLEKGLTTIHITEEDLVKEKGNWIKKVKRWLNQ